MSNGSLLTEERLRSWLDSNQVMRERMCIAILALNKNYSDIKPRRPKGGPDGGRDIEAIYKEKHFVYGAVGFRNSANDSSEDKRWVKEKFISDLAAGLKAKPDLSVFTFFTNIDLTPKEVIELEEFAKNKDIKFVDIYYRERIRIELDRDQGFAIRFNYLGIKLTDAEQLACF